MPRKTKSKAPSVEPEAQQAASDAAPWEDAPQAQQPTASVAAASSLDSHAPAPAETPAGDAKRDDTQATGTASHAAQQVANEQATGTTGTTPHEAGNVPPPSIAPDSAKALTAARACVRERLLKHPERPRIFETVREMRADPKLADMETEARERFIWGELDRLYPPKPPAETPDTTRSQGEEPLGRKGEDPQVVRGTERIAGLGDIPDNWPQLPAGASLTAEVGWVQAERLRIVEERPGGATVVTLSLARAPAPSWAALSWLETSIRSYAKFVEVAAKVASAPDDELQQAKRERMRIEEIRELLAEMLD